MCCAKNKKKDFAANFAMMTVSILYEKYVINEREMSIKNILFIYFKHKYIDDFLKVGIWLFLSFSSMYDVECYLDIAQQVGLGRA